MQVKREFNVRGQHKGAPSPATHLREAAHQGTYYPTQRVGPLKGFTKYLREAVHIMDLLPTRKAGGPTIGISHIYTQRGGRTKQAAGSNPRLRRDWRLKKVRVTPRPPRGGKQPTSPKRLAP